MGYKSIKNYIHVLASCPSSKPTCFFWLIIRLKAEYNTTQRRISHLVALVVGWLALRNNKYPCNISMAWRYMSIRHANEVFSKLHLLAEQGFKIKKKTFKKVQFSAVSFLTSDPVDFLQVTRISYLLDVSSIFKYVMYDIPCIWRTAM